MFLENINGPEDIKKLKVEDLRQLADETRQALINKLSKAGGHNGPNLGVVELTVAMHYVFDSPVDKIVFDVSHQCYPHKILTGRKQAFTDEAHFHDVTGFTNPLESEHDLFTVGHTSTSVSLAIGLAKARDAKKSTENVIALIGDGSLSGGEALEAIDYAGEYTGNLIIIVNDNDQSIAENHGGLYKNLRELRESDGKCATNIFRSFGLDYRYLEDGHDTAKLVELFESVKGIDHPIVLHIHTIKGKGLPYAEKNREAWHAGGPFNVADGSRDYMKGQKADTLVTDAIIDLLERDDKAIIVNAATPFSVGMGSMENRKKYAAQGRFIDVGIAEENAVAICSGIARNGGTPVFGTFAPFYQRVYDQMSHDVCLNSAPATFLVQGPGVYGSDSNTHTAMCDIQMFSHLPNMLYLAPTTRAEFLQMFRYATTQKSNPVGIRFTGSFQLEGEETADFNPRKNRVAVRGEGVALIAVGVLFPMALKVAESVREKTGKTITVIDPRFLSGVDEEVLNGLKKDHKAVITIEDGLVDGGYGQRIASFYGDTDMRVINHGLRAEFHTGYKAEELLREHGIAVDLLTEEIIGKLQ